MSTEAPVAENTIVTDETCDAQKPEVQEPVMTENQTIEEQTSAPEAHVEEEAHPAPPTEYDENQKEATEEPPELVTTKETTDADEEVTTSAHVSQSA